MREARPLRPILAPLSTYGKIENRQLIQSHELNFAEVGQLKSDSKKVHHEFHK